MAKQGTADRLTALCLLFFALLFSGCVRLSDRTPPEPWHEAYRPINDEASAEFINQALALAVKEFGPPAIPVNKVVLRRSRRTPEARRYALREDISMTSCVDRANGVFVVLIGVDPGQENYYALLGHECAHLINPYITDWYMEGMATVFSEQVCAALEKDWGDWKRRFSRSRHEPYALSYRMMRDVQAAFPEDYPALVRCVLPRAGDGDWQRIDIDRWIGSLPAGRQAEAVEIIRPYAKPLRKSTGPQYDFTPPSYAK